MPTRPEPALIVGFIAAALSLGTALGFPGLSAEQVAVIVGGVNAVGTVIVAVKVRPIAPAAFTGLVASVAAVALAYGFEVSSEVVGGVNALVLAALSMLTRAQVTPTSAAPLRPPVRREHAG